MSAPARSLSALVPTFPQRSISTNSGRGSPDAGPREVRPGFQSLNRIGLAMLPSRDPDAAALALLVGLGAAHRHRMIAPLKSEQPDRHQGSGDSRQSSVQPAT